MQRKFSMDSQTKSAGIGWVVFLLIAVAFTVYYSYFHESAPAARTEQSEQSPKQQTDSEYRDAMESKNYDPNSEGGERCFGQICN